MVMEYVFPNIGAAISFVLGLLAVIYPSKIETLVSIRSYGKTGVSEIRATYGGFFIGLSSFALISQIPTAFTGLGFGWIGASFIRSATLFFGYKNKKNILAVIFEAFIGLLCVSGVFFKSQY
jgi:hypothetical protein